VAAALPELIARMKAKPMVIEATPGKRDSTRVRDLDTVVAEVCGQMERDEDMRRALAADAEENAAVLARYSPRSRALQAQAARLLARIAALERELATLKTGHAANRGPGRPPVPRAGTAKKPKRKFTMTAKARAARKRQGQYLAALRRLKPAERTRVKALARKEGVSKAIAFAGKLAKAVPAKAA
jgi:hypothetical protein